MCLVSVTEHHAFKARPSCSVGQRQPFRGQAGACCVVSPLLPAVCQREAPGQRRHSGALQRRGQFLQSSSLVLSRLVGVQGRLAVGLVSVC